MAVELAAAYVSLTVSARGILDKVKAELGAPLERAVKDAGDKAGEGLSQGITKKTREAGKRAGKDIADGVAAGSAGAGKALVDPVAAAMKAFGVGAGNQLGSAFKAAAGDAGLDAGKALGKGVNSGFKAAAIGDDLTAPVVAAATKAGDKAGAGLGKGIEKAAKESGRQAGKNLDDGVAEGLKDVGKKLAGVFAAVQVGSFLKGAVDAAADAGEQLSKLNVLVGKSADGLDDWAKGAAEAFGLSRREALTAAGTFAGFFRNVGKSQDEAAGMSREFVELAADMAAFNNTSPGQAIEALGAALRGESEPIRAFNVMLDDATLKTRAFNMGLIATTKDALSPAIKVQAAYAEILAQTAVQQGNFGLTSGQLAGSQKILAAEFANAKAELGEALLPAMSKAVTAAKELLPAVAGLAENLAGLGGFALEAAGPVGSLLGAFLDSDIGNAAVAFTTVGLTLSGLVVPAVVKAKEAFDKLADAQLAASGAAGLAFAAVAAVGFSIYSAVKKDAADAAAASESLGKALTDAQDPLVTSREHADELAAAFGRLANSTGKAEESTVELDAAWAQQTIIDRGSIDLFNKAGIGIDRIALAMRKGKDSFHSFHADLDDSVRAGRISRDEYAKLADEVDFLGDAYQDQADKTNEANEAAIAAALNSGVLTQAQVDVARASRDVNQETGRYKTAYEILLPVLDAAAKKTGDIAPAADGAAGSLSDLGSAAAGSVAGQQDAAGSASDLAEAQDLAKDAAKKHEDALKELADGIGDYIDRTGDGQAATDDWIKSLQELAGQLAGQRLGLEIQNTGADVDLKGMDAQIKADTEAEVERLQDAKKVSQRATADEVEALQDAKKAEGRARDAEIARLQAQKASAEEIDAAQAAKTAANDAYDDAIDAARERTGIDDSFDQQIEVAQESAAAAMAQARANLGIASEASQEAFEALRDDADAKIQDLIDSGGDTLAVAELTNTLEAGLRAKADELGIILKDNQTGLEGNSKAALENRALLESMVKTAGEDIQKLIGDPGTTIEDVTAKAADLSEKIRVAGEAMGLSGPALDDYVNRVRGIGDAAVFSNDQLKALPSELALNIAYTMTLNAEQFKAELAVASQQFKDAMSREAVSLGIIEIDGASFALPRRAAGGPVIAGQAYWVGEHGPEPFIPDVNGTIIANDKVSVLAGGGGGVQIGAINITEAQSAAHVVDEVKARLGWELTPRNER